MADGPAPERRAGTPGPRLAHHLDYWRERLAGAPAHLDLPADYPRPPRKSYRGGAVRFRVDGGLVKRLDEAFAAADRALYLAKEAGRDRIVVNAATLA